MTTLKTFLDALTLDEQVTLKKELEATIASKTSGKLTRRGVADYLVEKVPSLKEENFETVLARVSELIRYGVIVF